MSKLSAIRTVTGFSEDDIQKILDGKNRKALYADKITVLHCAIVYDLALKDCESKRAVPTGLAADGD